MATTKEKATDTVNLTESFDKVKATAKNINAQLSETGSVVINDLWAKGKQLTDEATKTAKEAISKIDLTEGVNQAKATAKKANSYALETADELVEGTIKASEQWQGIAAKAVKGGLHLAAKQQELVFTTLEAVKEQVAGNAVRFRKLFKSN